jgi:hypothetical protein
MNNSSLKYQPEDSDVSGFEIVAEAKSVFSSPTFAVSSSSSNLQEKVVIRTLLDANGVSHHLVKYVVTKDTSGRQRTKMRKGKLCVAKNKCRDVGQYCITCGESFSLCNACDERDCFHEHVSAIKHITRKTKKNASFP